MNYLEYAKQMSNTLNQNKNMYNTAANIIQSPGATPPDGKLPGEILPPTTTSESLVENTKIIVDESNNFMDTNIFPQQNSSFNNSQSIYWSLMQHIITEKDTEKYEIMDMVMSFISSVAVQIQPVAVAPTPTPTPAHAPAPVEPVTPPMFGGNGTSESKEVLSHAVKLKKTIDSKTVKDVLISQTKQIISRYLNNDMNYVRAKLQPIINAQCQSIKDEIEAHAYTEPPKAMFGGNLPGAGEPLHFLMSEAIKKVRNKYFEIIGNAIQIDDLKTILNYSLIVSLNIPGPEHVDKMKNSIEKMIMKKDEVSKKVVDAMDLKTKIAHIIQYIDKNPALNNNLLECIKTNINKSCINDNFFVPIFNVNAKCVEQTLSQLAENTQIKYDDEVKIRSLDNIDISGNITPAQLNYTEQTLDSEPMKSEYQSQIKFDFNQNQKIISQQVWDIIQKKIEDVKDIDDGENTIKKYLDMYIKIYENIQPLSNHGLFLLFNDAKVIDKMNACLMLFGDYVYNVDLATCNNPRALIPDVNENNHEQIRIIPPPERPNDEQISKLILFLFKHHLRHFAGLASPNQGQPAADEMSVQLNATMENSSIYYGFEKELSEFIDADAELKDDEIVKRYVDVIFKKYINELKNKVYEKDLQKINEAMNKMQKGGYKKMKTRRRKKYLSLRKQPR